jgi:hypothetical protein
MRNRVGSIPQNRLGLGKESHTAGSDKPDQQYNTVLHTAATSGSIAHSGRHLLHHSSCCHKALILQGSSPLKLKPHLLGNTAGSPGHS